VHITVISLSPCHEESLRLTSSDPPFLYFLYDIVPQRDICTVSKMPLPAIDPLRAFVLACILIPVGYFAGEGYITWILTREWIFNLNSRDYYTAAFGLLPTAMGHVATIWGHYFRAEREFQHSITKVTTPVSVKQKISLWEHHIFWGYTVKYWILVAVIVLLNCGWVLISDLPYAKEELEEYSLLGGLGCKYQSVLVSALVHFPLGLNALINPFPRVHL